MSGLETSCIVIGGGAAGFFAAAAFGSCLLLEKTKAPLAKVRISGGGRCNVTHSCFDPKQFVTHYPRGSQELLGPFFRFCAKETIDWFAARGVELKTEKDGRIFPLTDSSQTIIDCLHAEIKKRGVELRCGYAVKTIRKDGDLFVINEEIRAAKVILTTGGSAGGHGLAKALGHTIVEPVPSLFTFHCPSSPYLDLSGLSCHGRACIIGTEFSAEGPILFTHFGLSGPCILKLSAYAARYLASVHYKAALLLDFSESSPLPNKLKKRLSAPQVTLEIDGKTVHKEEFVTCGGVERKEVDFRTMESKVCRGLYFAGEVLDVDAVTGGFNFQNAWTTGECAGRCAALSCTKAGPSCL